MDASLVVVEGRPLGAVIPLGPGRLLIGRDDRCQLRPKSPTVSLFHCALTRQGDRLTVLDLGSSNGTLVNDQFLQKDESQRLVDGDRLQVGQLIFRVRTSAEPPPEPPGDDAWERTLAEIGHGHDDPNGRTLLVSDLGVAGPTTGITPTESLTQAEDESPTFAHREFHSRPRAMDIGLNYVQMMDDDAVRATRKDLLALVSRVPSRRIVLDLVELDSLPSLAAATLLALALLCKNGGGELRLCGVQPAVKRLIRAIKIDGLARIYANRDAALVDPWV